MIDQRRACVGIDMVIKTLSPRGVQVTGDNLDTFLAGRLPIGRRGVRCPLVRSGRARVTRRSDSGGDSGGDRGRLVGTAGVAR